jgi:hypothetical protein
MRTEFLKAMYEEATTLIYQLKATREAVNKDGTYLNFSKALLNLTSAIKVFEKDEES